MAKKVFNFRQWLIDQRHFRVAWFAKDDQHEPEPEEALAELPETVVEEIIAQANYLPVPPPDGEAVAKAVGKAVAEWQAHPRVAPNSIVVLGHPISSVSRILTNSVETYIEDSDRKLPIEILDWVERPPSAKSIAQQIKEKFSKAGQEDDKDFKDGGDASESEVANLNLAIIPNLSWCFLRSLEGLNGIDYLQDTLLRDRSQFWIVGSGQVAWEYLNSTLKLNAYCGGTMALPYLSGEEIQDWLSPIVEKFEIKFTNAAIHKRLQQPKDLLEGNVSLEHPVEAASEIAQEVSATVQSSIRALKHEVLSDGDDKPEDEETAAQEDYFERLSDISDGVGIVALQLFLKSLRYKVLKASEVPEELETPENTPSSDRDKAKASGLKLTNENDNRSLIAVVPKLPPLPELDQSDMYLLYSLMLHGDLTIRALAESLGDAPQIVNNQVQVLRKAGIIEQQGESIKPNPIHYPRLRRELARNNFIIAIPGE